MTRLITLILAGICFFGCGREEPEVLLPGLLNQAEFISSGRLCGLCAGICVDTLVITPDKLRYKTTTWGEDEPTSDVMEQAFTHQGWNNLIGLVDVQEFQQLELESCARCYDGCDQWLRIRSGEMDHVISFPWNDVPSEVDSLTKALRIIQEELSAH